MHGPTAVFSLIGELFDAAFSPAGGETIFRYRARVASLSAVFSLRRHQVDFNADRPLLVDADVRMLFRLPPSAVENLIRSRDFRQRFAAVHVANERVDRPFRVVAGEELALPLVVAFFAATAWITGLAFRPTSAVCDPGQLATHPCYQAVCVRKVCRISGTLFLP